MSRVNGSAQKSISRNQPPAVLIQVSCKPSQSQLSCLQARPSPAKSFSSPADLSRVVCNQINSCLAQLNCNLQAPRKLRTRTCAEQPQMNCNRRTAQALFHGQVATQVQLKRLVQVTVGAQAASRGQDPRSGGQPHSQTKLHAIHFPIKTTH